MTDLHWARVEDITLAEALAAEPLTDAIGMISTTAWHGFALVEGTELRTPTDTVDPATVFEARVFAPGPVELRWLHESGGKGTAVRVTDQPLPNSESTHVHTTFDHTQLLWGLPDGGDATWSTLREHRTGVLPVPLAGPCPTGHRAVLTTREYIGLDKFGNATVLDQLITGLAWTPPVQWTFADQKAGA
ncbi:type III-D CRISPR-associated protein Csx19 [Actinokineospora sp. G85]|uniref:type III-D CRISPR-associated protein Csx19 n=1 Tax=Actinokineospora sp. G85 TaxID=3406626 RepID=UPI003C72E8D9